MKKLLRPLAVVVLVAVAAFAVAVAPDNTDNNTNDETENTTDANGNQGDENQSDENTDEQSGTAYSYAAQAGDSYTKMARKAVQTYGIDNDVKLSQAEIIAAETFLTSDAGFPLLDVGQSVELSADTVKGAVDKAVALDDAAEARWARYVPGVDFNTDNVGEARS